MSGYTQTTEQAIEAIEAAGHKAYGSGPYTKFYDPRKRGAFLRLEAGYKNKTFASYCETTQASARKGGPSGAFCDEIRRILEANRADIAAAGVE